MTGNWQMLVVHWGSCHCNLSPQPLRTIYSILRSITCWNACLWVRFWSWTLCKTCKQAQFHFNKWSNTSNGVCTGCIALIYHCLQITPSKSAHPLELKPNHRRPGLIKCSAWDGKKRGTAPKCYKLPTGLGSLGRPSSPRKGTRELGGQHSKSWLEGFGGGRWREGGGVKQSLLQVHTSVHCCSAPNANHKGGEWRSLGKGWHKLPGFTRFSKYSNNTLSIAFSTLIIPLKGLSAWQTKR